MFSQFLLPRIRLKEIQFQKKKIKKKLHPRTCLQLSNDILKNSDISNFNVDYDAPEKSKFFSNYFEANDYQLEWKMIPW